MPIAGFWGSGLAWIVDILSGVLTGGNHAGRVKDPFDDFTGPQNIGHLFITFKTNLFVKNYNPKNINCEKSENIAILNAPCGNVIIELYPDISPKAVERFKILIEQKLTVIFLERKI